MTTLQYKPTVVLLIDLFLTMATARTYGECTAAIKCDDDFGRLADSSSTTMTCSAYRTYFKCTEQAAELCTLNSDPGYMLKHSSSVAKCKRMRCSPDDCKGLNMKNIGSRSQPGGNNGGGFSGGRFAGGNGVGGNAGGSSGTFAGADGVGGNGAGFSGDGGNNGSGFGGGNLTFDAGNYTKGDYSGGNTNVTLTSKDLRTSEIPNEGRSTSETKPENKGATRQWNFFLVMMCTMSMTLTQFYLVY